MSISIFIFYLNFNIIIFKILYIRYPKCFGLWIHEDKGTGKARKLLFYKDILRMTIEYLKTRSSWVGAKKSAFTLTLYSFAHSLDCKEQLHMEKITLEFAHPTTINLVMKHDSFDLFFTHPLVLLDIKGAPRPLAKLENRSAFDFDIYFGTKDIKELNDCLSR